MWRIFGIFNYLCDNNLWIFVVWVKIGIDISEYCCWFCYYVSILLGIMMWFWIVYMIKVNRYVLYMKIRDKIVSFIFSVILLLLLLVIWGFFRWVFFLVLIWLILFCFFIFVVMIMCGFIKWYRFYVVRIWFRIFMILCRIYVN